MTKLERKLLLTVARLLAQAIFWGFHMAQVEAHRLNDLIKEVEKVTK